MSLGLTMTGRVAVVTGGSRGIGESIAVHILRAGADAVVVTGRRPEGLKDAAGRIAEAAGVSGDRVCAVVGNVAEPTAAEETIATAVERHGRCDVLVNNAGTNPASGAVTEVDMSAVDRTWEVNLRAPLVWTRVAVDAWMGEHGGVVLNLGSVGGLAPSPWIGAYNVSKAGLHHLTRQLAHELAPKVRVNAIAAAVVKTRLSEGLWSADEEAAAARHPMGRLGEPEDVAVAATWLCSDQASWITGVILPVDGGASGAGSLL